MGSKKKYSEETRAAVMASLLAGQSVTQAADAHGVPRGTVAHWSASLRDTKRNVSDDNKERIGDLLVEYLTEALQTMKEQVKIARDEKWLKQQEASQFAVLHGVISDKATKILEALTREEDAEE
jgi:transposase-like protein